ncbi:hypothetical protein DFS34DRAFT_124917 [Phlyctochytrium arcticum]|nr:hypothetical protein DFS34DRAFT_124917 [Phlyctochytrium arcticum]
MPHNKVGDVEKSPSINFRTNAVSEVARFSANLRNAFEVSTGGQGTKTDLGANSTNPPSTDQSLSAHSEGTGSSKPSRRVWSLSRFWRFLRRGRMPIVMILVIVISSLTALTGFLSWGLTNISATVFNSSYLFDAWTVGLILFYVRILSVTCRKHSKWKLSERWYVMTISSRRGLT